MLAHREKPAPLGLSLRRFRRNVQAAALSIRLGLTLDGLQASASDTPLLVGDTAAARVSKLAAHTGVRRNVLF
jgi:hypothetical protein